MIRHQVYFDTLGSLREDSASWRAAFAGLSVLRLVDAYTDNSASVDPANWAQLHSVRSAVEDVSAGDPIRGVLSSVLEETIVRGTIDEVVCRSLLAYGRALDYEVEARRRGRFGGHVSGPEMASSSFQPSSPNFARQSL